MKKLKIIFFVACMVAFLGCLDSSTGSDKPIPEPTIKSEYYFTNKSGFDLNATYTIATAEEDSTVIVPTDSMTKILEVGSIGGDTFPSSAFENLRFYKVSGDKRTPLLTIDPIDNDDWNRTAGEIDNVSKYELVITGEDVK